MSAALTEVEPMAKSENPFAPRPDLKVWIDGQVVSAKCRQFLDVGSDMSLRRLNAIDAVGEPRVRPTGRTHGIARRSRYFHVVRRTTHRASQRLAFRGA